VPGAVPGAVAGAVPGAVPGGWEALPVSSAIQGALGALRARA
jgi:hypothetical protein